MKKSDSIKMIGVKDELDIPEIYRNTPISRMILCHNLKLHPETYDKADALVLMCMDNRQSLNLPKKCAFFVRNSGGTQNGVSFSISFAIAVAGIRHIVVIGHSDCMMVDLESKKAEFVKGLSENAGWDRAIAESYFLDSCALFKKKDKVGSVVLEAELIRSQYPDTVVAPLFYSLDDDLLYLIEEEPEQVLALK